MQKLVLKQQRMTHIAAGNPTTAQAQALQNSNHTDHEKEGRQDEACLDSQLKTMTASSSDHDLHDSELERANSKSELRSILPGGFDTDRDGNCNGNHNTERETDTEPKSDPLSAWPANFKF
jgi:hypothetical protein